MVDKNLLKEIEEYAKKEKVPIMQKEGIKYLINYNLLLYLLLVYKHNLGI